MARRYPKWSTPSRQVLLVKLFQDSQGFCVYGHHPCLIPEHHYEIYTELLIDDWKAEDRLARHYDWLAERIQLHHTNDRRLPLQGQFSGVSKDIFFASQPDYYLLCLGVSGLTFKPFAQVRVSSSFVSLYVDLGDTLKKVSKSRRRKAIRYGKPLASDIQAEIADKCKMAVRHYLTNR
jgi:hypothetical protein